MGKLQAALLLAKEAAPCPAAPGAPCGVPVTLGSRLTQAWPAGIGVSEGGAHPLVLGPQRWSFCPGGAGGSVKRPGPGEARCPCTHVEADRGALALAELPSACGAPSARADLCLAGSGLAGRKATLPGKGKKLWMLGTWPTGSSLFRRRNDLHKSTFSL